MWNHLLFKVIFITVAVQSLLHDALGVVAGISHIIDDGRENCSCVATQNLSSVIGMRICELVRDVRHAGSSESVLLRIAVDQSKFERIQLKGEIEGATKEYIQEELDEVLKIEQIESEVTDNFQESARHWFLKRDGLFDGTLPYLILLTFCAAISCRIGMRVGRISVMLRVASVYFMLLFLISVPFNFYYLYRAELAKQYATVMLNDDGQLAARCLPLAFGLGSVVDMGQTGDRRPRLVKRPEEASVFDSLGPFFAWLLPRWLMPRRADAEAECERFYAALLNVPRVTPIRAFSFTLWTTLFEPLEPLGDALARFLSAFSFLERVLCFLVFLILAFVCSMLTLFGVHRRLSTWCSRTEVGQLTQSCVAQAVTHSGTADQRSATTLACETHTAGVRIFEDQDAIHIAYDAEYGQLFARVAQRPAASSPPWIESAASSIHEDDSTWCVHLGRYKPTQRLHVYEPTHDALILDDTQFEALVNAIPRVRAALRRRMDRTCDRFSMSLLDSH